MKNRPNSKERKEALKSTRQSELIVNSLVWINKNLLQKYCQSQNYYYTRDVNEILGDASSKAVVRYKDWVGYDDDDEYLKRYYYGDEYPQKIQLLTEYYKFHTDIARIFMEPIATVLNKYYDKKRKYEYYRIAHLIEEENKKNPNRPPKGIVGERPSPANSQDSQRQQESPNTVKRIRNIQILKDLSWLNKSSQIPKKKSDVSCTLQEICKQLGNVGLEQSSLLISSGKGDEMRLDKFLAYLNQQTYKTQRDKASEIQKQTKKLSQPHEQLIQTLIQKQHDEIQQRMGSQHSKQNTELIQQMNKISRDINVNFIKNQVDSLMKHKQSNENLQSRAKVDQNDQIKQSINPKSKTIVQQQPKISTQLFLKDLRKNVQQVPLHLNRQFQNPVLSPTSNQSNTQKTQATNQISIGKLNLKQISKIFIEEDPTEQELKWKNGSQTHRPMSGTKNFFSNRNSPTASRGAQFEFKTNQARQTSGQISTHSQISQQQPSQKTIKAPGSQTTRKAAQPNIHIRYTSNQDKIININININDNLQNQKLKQTKHKKNQSDGKQLNTHLLDTQQEFVCLTDRAGQGEFVFKNSIAASCQNSPKTQKLKRVGSGSGMSTLKNSGSTRNSFIQQMLTQVSKQQPRQDLFSSQFRKPN
ncbi:unnamed protein product [Paramecium octaurelia]|uniref:Uncharacterized protein n=1 Tax=Paramecium octaurelia TaxID=43137 RepID=A0A8S1YFD8_PAROT|nr:unnamed protein product [Paramecium octaurelia]